MTQVEALREIYRRDGGIITPAAVVAAAEPEDSPLHGVFCWDDTEAARLYRLDQAQRLIRRFAVKITDEKGRQFEVPMFVNLSVDRVGTKDENPYRMTEDVAKCEDLLAVAVRDALEQLEALRERYRHLKQLDVIWRAIDECKKKKR